MVTRRDEAGEGAGRKSSDVQPEEYREFFSRASTRSNVDYTAMIERWQAEYPPGRMLVASNDEVRERPVELLARVFTHLGVSVPTTGADFPLAR